MQVNQVINRQQLHSVVIGMLKDCGIKHNKLRKSRPEQKQASKRIFGVQLHQLQLSDVILADGTVVQIPHFMAEACDHILENVEIEGIFRKAGSANRQKDMRANLEDGATLGRCHHVIDVANVLKYFIRELPEPLIPTALQQTLLRSFLIGEQRLDAILLTCLLLPPLEGNTLAFFMQFLLTVSHSMESNKMSTENLAIIFTPSIMPCFNMNSVRFNNHVKTVQLLIEHANSIGIVPESVRKKLILLENSHKKNGVHRSLEILDNVLKNNKQKRRTEIFTGLKKMVGTSRSNLLNLEVTPTDAKQQEQQPIEQTTVKSTKKKRKFADPIYTFSAKKKKDVLAAQTPNTPLTRKNKLPRRSLGGTRFMKNIINQSIHPASTSVERRWSLVGPSWSKRPFYYTVANNEQLPTIKDETLQTSDLCRKTLDISEENILPANNSVTPKTKAYSDLEDAIDSKKEESLSDKSNDTQLAQGLHHKLRIRCLDEENHLKNTRSPRVRKIGAQRNHDKPRLTRTQTWHISSTSAEAADVTAHKNTTVPLCKRKPQVVTPYKNRKQEFKENLSPEEAVFYTPKGECAQNTNNISVIVEDWTPADCFFTPAKSKATVLVDTENIKNLKYVEGTPFQTPKTPKRQTKNSQKERDSMLPPSRLPMHKFRTPKNTPAAVPNNTAAFTPMDENGRASIARLRTQNAGMVMAKAKLFDGLVDASTMLPNSALRAPIKRSVPRSAVRNTPRKRETAFKVKTPAREISKLNK